VRGTRTASASPWLFCPRPRIPHLTGQARCSHQSVVTLRQIPCTAWARERDGCGPILCATCREHRKVWLRKKNQMRSRTAGCSTFMEVELLSVPWGFAASKYSAKVQVISTVIVRLRFRVTVWIKYEEYR